jgi:NTP pyrophosphatase (non-canonical NTP hydrolase)
MTESTQPLTFNRYQHKALVHATYPQAGKGSVPGLSYTVLGLNGEAGEVAEKVKKLIRDADGQMTAEFRAETLKEIGDCLWYISAACRELGYSMEEAAEASLTKLDDRAARGVLGGSGDNR